MAPSASKKIDELSDNELIARYLRDQNTTYFTLLYRRYGRKVFAKCITMLSDEGLARDATQDIFVKVLLNLSKFTEQSSFSTWVYSITYNYCIDLIRKKKKMPLIFSEDVSKISKETEVEIPDSVLLEMKKERLEKVLDRLPPGDRAILEMKYSEDLPIREIGEVLGKTESAIKMQIMRAKMKAQSIYEELYGDSAVEEDVLPERRDDDPEANDAIPAAAERPQPHAGRGLKHLFLFVFSFFALLHKIRLNQAFRHQVINSSFIIHHSSFIIYIRYGKQLQSVAKRAGSKASFGFGARHHWPCQKHDHNRQLSQPLFDQCL